MGDGVRWTVRRWGAGADQGIDDGDPDGQHPDPAPAYVPPSCGMCGRRLMLGEPLDRFRADDRLVVVCPVCGPVALDAGYVRVETDDDERRWYVRQGQVTRVERRSAARAA